MYKSAIGVGGTTLPEMDALKSKLDELLDIIKPVIKKGVKCQSNKGEVEINKTGSISEISHEPDDKDESYADEWIKVFCEGKNFELKSVIPATNIEPEFTFIQTVNIEFSVSIAESQGVKSAKLNEPIIITLVY